MRYSWYGQMSPGQMLPGQMSPWQLKSVLDVPGSLPLKFHQNRVSNSWDIADIEFVWDGWSGKFKVIFMSNPTYVMLGWGWVWILTKILLAFLGAPCIPSWFVCFIHKNGSVQKWFKYIQGQNTFIELPFKTLGLLKIPLNFL